MLLLTKDLGMVEILPAKDGCTVHFLKLGLSEDSSKSPSEYRDGLLNGAPC